MSSNNSSSPRDHEMPIPTICLHSLNDSGPQLENYPNNSDSDWHSGDEQSFGSTITNFCSWLSQFGAYKKFLVGAALCFQCEVNFFRSQTQTCQHLPNTHTSSPLESDPIKWLDTKLVYVYSVQWNTLSCEQFLVELTSLLSILTSPTSCYIHCRLHSGLSNSPSAERMQQSEHIPPTLTSYESMGLESGSNLNQLCDKFHRLKGHYIRLFIELLYHTDSWDVLFPTLMDSSLITGQSCDIVVKEHVCQSLIGQLLLKTVLHPIFSHDDHAWIIHILRTHHRTLNMETVKLTERANHLYKLFHCFLEVVLDACSVVQTVNAGFDAAASHFSISPSLTSSGFLSVSGGGGSGSQYDLLSEATNTTHQQLTSGQHYGSLLTVPSSDARILPSQNHSPHQGVQNSSGLDTPNGRQSEASAHFAPKSPSCASSHNPHPLCMHTANSRSVADCTFNGSTPRRVNYQLMKPGVCSRASFSNTLDPSMSGLGTEQTGDSASLSSTSSVFSSSLDLGVPSLQRLSVSPSLSTTDMAQRAGLEDVSSSSPSPTSIHKRPANALTYVIDSQSSSLPSDTMDRDCTGTNAAIPISPSVWADDSFSSKPRDYTNGASNQNGAPLVKIQSRDGTCSYSDPHSGMFAVPVWLKSLRLHKYAGLFEHLTYDEFMQTTQTWLENQHVTQGARTKLLLNLKKLSTRKADLIQLENALLQTPIFSSSTVFAIHDCLSAIWNMFHTPFKPCPADRSHNSLLLQCHGALEDDQSIVRTLPKIHVLNRLSCSHSSGYKSEYVTESSQSQGEKGKKLFRTLTVGSCESTLDSASNECLPCQMMICLTKVCSRLLVTPHPDIQCCRRFIQLLDMVNTHPAFSQKHKRLAASWRRQMFSIEDSILYRTHPSDPQRISRSVPRFHHQRVKQPKQQRSHMLSPKQPGLCKLGVGSIASPYKSTDQLHGRFYPIPMVDSVKQIPGMIFNDCKIDKSVGDNGYRRHSVPANQIANGPMSLRTCSGRRMPSPNPTYPTNRRNIFPISYPEPRAIKSQAVSDMDVSHLVAPNCAHARFPSPTAFDYSPFRLGPPNKLAPPATAPATRLPSPSDVNRHPSFFADSSVPDAFRTSCVGRFPDQMKFGISEPIGTVGSVSTNSVPFCCSATVAGYMETEYNMYLPDMYNNRRMLFQNCHNFDPSQIQAQRSAQPTYKTDEGSREVQMVQHSTEFANPNLSPQCVSAEAIDNVINAASDESCAKLYMQSTSFTVPSELYDFRHQQCCKSGVQWPVGPDLNTDHIDHDLELLTRNVTELAIGDSDSPVGEAK